MPSARNNSNVFAANNAVDNPAAPASVRGRMRPENGAAASSKKKAKAAAKAVPEHTKHSKPTVNSKPKLTVVEGGKSKKNTSASATHKRTDSKEFVKAQKAAEKAKKQTAKKATTTKTAEKNAEKSNRTKATKVASTAKSTKATAKRVKEEKPARQKSESKLLAFFASKTFRFAIVPVLVIAFAAVIIYPSAKSYYIADRDKQLVEAEYALVQERNQELQDEIDTLKTDEGIENQARAQYGYSYEDENSVVVEGIDNSALELPDQVSASDVKLEENAWTQFCDMIFGLD